MKGLESTQVSIVWTSTDLVRGVSSFEWVMRRFYFENGKMYLRFERRVDSHLWNAESNQVMSKTGLESDSITSWLESSQHRTQGLFRAVLMTMSPIKVMESYPKTTFNFSKSKSGSSRNPQSPHSCKWCEPIHKPFSIINKIEKSTRGTGLKRTRTSSV